MKNIDTELNSKIQELQRENKNLKEFILNPKMEYKAFFDSANGTNIITHCFKLKLPKCLSKSDELKWFMQTKELDNQRNPCFKNNLFYAVKRKFADMLAERIEIE